MNITYSYQLNATGIFIQDVVKSGCAGKLGI